MSASLLISTVSSTSMAIRPGSMPNRSVSHLIFSISRGSQSCPSAKLTPDPRHRQPGRVPGAQRLQRAGQHQLADPLGEIRLLGEIEERARLQQPALGMLPARQRLEPGEARRWPRSACGWKNGTICPASSAVQQLGEQRLAPLHLEPQLLAEIAHAARPRRLRRGQRDLGIGQHPLRVRPVVRQQRHPDAAADPPRAAADREAACPAPPASGRRSPRRRCRRRARPPPPRSRPARDSAAKSPARSAFWMRRAAIRSTSSAVPWPSASRSTLKRSRSTRSTAVCRRARSLASASRAR